MMEWFGRFIFQVPHMNLGCGVLTHKGGDAWTFRHVMTGTLCTSITGTSMALGQSILLVIDYLQSPARAAPESYLLSLA
jgi:hypothetical protein